LLQTFAHADDERRAVWLRFASESADPELFRKAVVFVMQAEGLDDTYYYLALRNHMAYLENEIDIDAISLSTEKEDRIRRFLDRDSATD